MNLKACLQKNGVEFEFIDKIETHTAKDAAKAIDITLDNIIKTLLFIDENREPLIAIVRGDCHVSRKKLQKALNLKKAMPAKKRFASKITGYPPGGIPPVCHKKKLRSLIDRLVLEKEELYCGGGSRKKLVKLKTKDIARLSNGIVCDIIISSKKELSED